MPADGKRLLNGAIKVFDVPQGSDVNFNFDAARNAEFAAARLVDFLAQAQPQGRWHQSLLCWW
jgi:hypothetical protein